MTPPEQHLLSAVFEERLRDLAQYRTWHRTRDAFLRPYFRELEAEHRIELRALLRLRSQVKRAQRRLDYHASVAHDLGQAVMEEDMAARGLTFDELRRDDFADEIELGLL